jgi:GntR family transcriptional regulator
MIFDSGYGSMAFALALDSATNTIADGKPLMKIDFFQAYGKPHIAGLPKYAQLREALRTAIEDGYWQPGEKLPPEIEIAATTPFSLGTVQKAMRALVKEGIIERRPGSGTFVAIDRRQMYDPWHFRFTEDGEQNFLSVYPKVIAKKVISSQEPWARLINPSSERLIQINRIITIGDAFSIFSRFFLSADKFSGFLTKTKKELESVNFKTILRHEYNLSIRYMNHTVQMAELPPEVAKAIPVPQGTVGILLSIVALSSLKAPTYYQEVFIPPNNLKLHISDSSFIPERWW